MPYRIPEKQNWKLKGDLELLWSMEGTEQIWQERFARFLELADNPILAIDQNAEIFELNQAAERHCQVPKQKLVGASLSKAFPSSGFEPNVQSIEHFFKNYESWGPGEGVLSRVESRSLLRWQTVRLVDEQKQTCGLVLFGKDVTAEHLVQDKLKRTLRELEDEKRAVDSAAIVAITDTKGDITYANEKFCKLSQFSKEELIGKNHRIINSGYHSKTFWDGLWKTISNGKTWQGEIRNQAKDGTYYWVDTTIIPFLNDQRKPYRYVSIRFDITKQKLAQKQVDEERMRSVYAERLASLGELAAGIAHEIGTPLATIRGRMELLEVELGRNSLDAEKLKTTVKTVTEQTDRMARIIRSVLNSARDGSKDPLRRVNLRDLICSIIEYSSDKFRKNRITVKTDGFPKNLEIKCRETQLSQVFGNLLSNACDAVTKLEDRWVEVTAKETGAFVEIRIADSGPGISVETAKKIMEPFFSTKDVGKGTGLGLSISKRLIEEHGGRLELDQHAPHTTFVITLPHQLDKNAI